MRLSTEIVTLHLAHTFTIARSSVDTEQVCVVRLEHDGITAYGEGAPVDYWGETPHGIAEAVAADGARLLGPDLLGLDGIGARLRAWDGPQGAKMALDGAVHDWFGKRLGQPVWRLFGLGPVTPPTSFTIGIASVDETVAKVREAAGYQVYKIKVGGPDDLALETPRRRRPTPRRERGEAPWGSTIGR